MPWFWFFFRYASMPIFVCKVSLGMLVCQILAKNYGSKSEIFGSHRQDRIGLMWFDFASEAIFPFSSAFSFFLFLSLFSLFLFLFFMLLIIFPFPDFNFLWHRGFLFLGGNLRVGKGWLRGFAFFFRSISEIWKTNEIQIMKKMSFFDAIMTKSVLRMLSEKHNCA